MTVCKNCGGRMRKPTPAEVGYGACDLLCPTCGMALAKCSQCDETNPIEDMKLIEGKYVCDKCVGGEK